jgi:hypothetical protein
MMRTFHDQNIFTGIVISMESNKPEAFAKIRLSKPKCIDSIVGIKVKRLIAAGITYVGARFTYTITDVGADRTITITADKEAS